MALELSTGSRNAMADAIDTLVKTGGNGTIQIRTGSQPASPNDAASGTLLATLTNLTFGDAAAGVITAAAITSDTSVDDNGTAGYARILNGSGATVADMDIGEGSGTLSFDDIDFVAGGTAAISSLTITVPES